jgi:hypothetical protein
MTKSHLAVLSNLIGFYNAGDLVGIAEFTHVLRALKAASRGHSRQRHSKAQRRTVLKPLKS